MESASGKYRRSIHVFQSCTVLRDFGEGEEREAHKLLLASRYRQEPIGKVISHFQQSTTHSVLTQLLASGKVAIDAKGAVRYELQAG